MNTLKPYQLIDVLSEDRNTRTTGEVISMRTPEGTYMVRMIPGVAGTLQEVPEGRLVKSLLAGRKRIYVHYATIRQNPISERVRSFPVDMLRYDSAVPLNFKMQREDDREKYVLDNGYPHPIVADVTARPKPTWTHDRWNSFGARAEPLKTESVELVKGMVQS